MVFDTDMDQIVVRRIKLMEVPTGHQSVRAGERQSSKPFPFRIARNAKPIATAFRCQIVHLLNTARHDDISLTAFDGHPSVSKGETR